MQDDVRDALKSIISGRGFIQATIAKNAGMSPSKLSAILNKNRRLDVNEMLAICSALGIKPEELWNPEPKHLNSA